MEINVVSFKSSKVTVLFTGSNYFFYSDFFGVIAAAERVTKSPGTDCEDFIITVGNRHTVGGSYTNTAVVSFVKRFINKSENKYITKSVSYTVRVADLADNSLRVSLK